MKGRLRIPAEWEPHEACWIAFPYLADEWLGMLPRAQLAIAELCHAVAGPGAEPVRLLVKDEGVEAAARTLLGEPAGIDYVRADYGDCWVRDTLPSFGWLEDGRRGGLRFRFNGWGQKYDIPFDDSIGAWLSNHLHVDDVHLDLFLEGGALEFDGAGTVITTASCVLDANRNPGLTRAEFEDALRVTARVERIVWLERGLDHDHTDGHVDMLARFTAPNTVVCMAPNPKSPNAEVLSQVQKSLTEQGLELLEVPAAPDLHAPDGTPLPATYCNFYVANAAVIVPTYDVPEDTLALEVLASAYPGRTTVGLPARDLLCGGGSFHCATQPFPAGQVLSQ